MNQIEMKNNRTAVTGQNLCMLFKLFVILPDLSSFAKCCISLNSALSRINRNCIIGHFGAISSKN